VRLAFLSNAFAGVGHHTSGLGNHLLRLTTALARRGHDCHVICNAEGLAVRRERVRRVEGVTVHVVPDDHERLVQFPVLPPGTPCGPLRAYWSAARKTDELHAVQPFDAIQTPNFTFASLFLDADAPVLMRLSSYSPVWRQAEVDGTSAPYPLEWYVEFILEREAVLAADACFAPSRFLCDTYRDALGIDVTLLRPPAFVEIPRRRWDRAWMREAIRAGRHYFVYVDALNRRKGAHVLANALPALFRRCPQIGLHLAGDDLGGLEQMQRTAGPHRHRIRHHGVIDHRRLYPLLEGAIGLVFPSLADNLPNAVIEALLLGVPVITTSARGSDELMTDGVSGFLVPPGDAAALADAMTRLAQLAPLERAAMGIEARRAAEAAVDPASTVAAFERFVTTAARRRPDQPRRLPSAVRLRLVAALLADLARLSQESQSSAGKRLAFAPMIRQLILDAVPAVTVYGAGEAGRMLAHELSTYGVRVTGFVDSDRRQWGAIVDGIRVASPAQAIERGAMTFAIGSIAFATEIRRILERDFAHANLRIYGPGRPPRGVRQTARNRPA
jgi:glycosyltransferase involved in cell wall biosynthesis